MTSERGKNSTLNHEVNTGIVWRAGRRIDIRPSYSYFSAAGYSENSYSLEGEFRF